ncbi:hypothetical protein AAFP32_04590 [Brevibacterium sp. CBA3109]|uniref:Uncharacterized protein n=1 Tax=Brevibacterium koreense TaxID=3140787 RepID=A0AAU7UPG0_9MICO
MSKIPTHYPVKYKCGHSASTDLSKVPPSRRAQAARSDFYATKAGKDQNGMICPSCFKKQRATDTESFLNQLMLDTEAFETEHDLAALEGTDRMVSSGLVDSARRDRYTVLSTLLGDDTEYPDNHDDVLSAAQALTWAGWWANTLSYGIRKDNDYGQEEFYTLVIDGAEQEAKRDKSERIVAENPHDSNPDESE